MTDPDPGDESRLLGLDVLRGLAVLLMVLDHALVAAGDIDSPLRLTLTRAALPLFAVVAGSLVGPAPRWRRLGVVAAAAAPATVLGRVVGVGQPDVLVLLVGALAVAPWVLRAHPLMGAGIAVVQPVTWPMGWGGYEPGTVLVLVLVGAWAGRDAVSEAAPRLPRLAVLGRHALGWYVGHLVVLAAATALL